MPGWDEHPRAGHSNGDPFEMPADLAAVQADDALLDMIGRGHVPSGSDDELARVLAAWRHEVHAEPVRELVDTSTALALIRAAARRPARRRSPVFGSLAGAAALVVIAFSSVGLVAKSAEPGDPLWGVTQVLYSEYAESVETAAAVRTELNTANTALQQGRPQQAREALQRIRQQLPAVGEREGHAELTTAHHQLEQKLNKPPDPGSIKNLPGASGFPPPVRAGSEAPTSEAGKPDQTTVPSPQRTSTTPDSRGELPNRPPGMDSNQFFPRDARDPRRYYDQYPGTGGRPGRGAQDFRPPMEGKPADKDSADDTLSDSSPDDHSNETDTRDQRDLRRDDYRRLPSPSPAPSPSPRPETGSTTGTGSGAGQVDKPQMGTPRSRAESFRS